MTNYSDIYDTDEETTGFWLQEEYINFKTLIEARLLRAKKNREQVFIGTFRRMFGPAFHYGYFAHIVANSDHIQAYQSGERVEYVWKDTDEPKVPEYATKPKEQKPSRRIKEIRANFVEHSGVTV